MSSSASNDAASFGAGLYRTGQPVAIVAESRPPTFRGPKLLERVRRIIRAKHYSHRTEDTYVSWIRRFILFHSKKHPTLLGQDHVREFLTYLAAARGLRLPDILAR